MLFWRCVFFSLLFAALISHPLSAQPPAIVFGGDTNYPPYEWEDADGAPKGFLIDLEDSVAKSGSANAVHRLAPWPDTVAALRSGAVDVVPMFRSKERAKDFWFSRPVFFANHAIFTASDPGRVTELAELASWRIVVERSSFAHDQLASDRSARELVLVGNTQDAIRALVSKEADYAILAEAPAMHLIENAGLAVSRVGIPFWPRAYSFAVRKDRTDLISSLEQSFARTISNGEFQRIQARWQPQSAFNRNGHPSLLDRFREIIVALTALFVAGMLLLFFWLHPLSRESRERKGAKTSSAEVSTTDNKLLKDFKSSAENEIYAVFQPQLDLHSGKITGAEALARWQHPELGAIGPDRFVPLIERAGLIGMLTLRMIESAVKQSVIFRERGCHLRFSVNVSATDFTDLDFYHQVADCVQRCGGCPKDLVLELTESGAINDLEAVREIIEKLQAIGIRVAIDDFGTGFSSLASFTELSFNELKVDRFFVERMTSSDGHREAVASAINMAQRMKMEVVAEGAPDLATIRLLESMGCDKVQSYAVSPPLHGEDLLNFVQEFLYSRASFGFGSSRWAGRSRATVRVVR